MFLASGEVPDHILFAYAVVYEKRGNCVKPWCRAKDILNILRLGC
jgi:hypothetical protein